jgi:hypothetical protein
LGCGGGVAGGGGHVGDSLRESFVCWQRNVMLSL